jgi:NarL family two-component system response regulator LiaR
MGSEGLLRVLIIDDQPVVRFGLRCLLDDDPALHVVGETTGDREGVQQLVKETRPDLVLIDPGRDELKALESLRNLCAASPHCRVIVYTTGVDEPRLVVSALEMGVSAFLLKANTLEQLRDDIRKVHEGDAVLAPAVANKLAEHFNQQSRVPQTDTDRPLTERELEVLGHLAQGKTNRAIAKLLYVCEATVKFHVHSILQKLQAANRTEAVLIAAQQGFVQLPKTRAG